MFSGQWAAPLMSAVRKMYDYRDGHCCAVQTVHQLDAFEHQAHVFLPSREMPIGW
jgi:hypothetical protein